MHTELLSGLGSTGFDPYTERVKRQNGQAASPVSDAFSADGDTVTISAAARLLAAASASAKADVGSGGIVATSSTECVSRGQLLAVVSAVTAGSSMAPTTSATLTTSATAASGSTVGTDADSAKAAVSPSSASGSSADRTEKIKQKLKELMNHLQQVMSGPRPATEKEALARPIEQQIAELQEQLQQLMADEAKGGSGGMVQNILNGLSA